MGECCSIQEEPEIITDEIHNRKNDQQTNDTIDSRIIEQQVRDSNVKKLLLLGSGSSGKSTLFKQLKCISSKEIDEIFKENEITEGKATIRRNCLGGTLLLLKKSQEFAQR
ncbi:hypothetical protein RFI_10278, partial [Reticulomyxa filosa]